MPYFLSEKFRCTCSHWGRNLKIHSPGPRREKKGIHGYGGPVVFLVEAVSPSQSFACLVVKCSGRSVDKRSSWWPGGRGTAPSLHLPFAQHPQGPRVRSPLCLSRAPMLPPDCTAVPVTHLLSHPCCSVGQCNRRLLEFKPPAFSSLFL